MNADKIDFDPGPLHETGARPDGDRWTLIFRQHFDHGVESVWRALTDPGELRAWAPYTSDRDLGSTGPANLIMIDGDHRTEVQAEVLVARAPHLLEFDWGGQLLRWELISSDGNTGRGTDLVLEHTIDARNDLSKMAAGWHLCLLVADDHLSGGTQPPIVGETAYDYGWNDLEQRYAARLTTES